jgi:hypothetical protein
MPRGDRTGPAGLGPGSGRGAGFCAGYSVPGFMNPVWGGGGGRGWGGGGRGWGGGGGGWRYRHGFRAPFGPGWQQAWASYPPHAMAAYPPFTTKDQELEILKNQAKSFEQALEDVRRRIRDVESKTEESAAT